MASKLSIRRAQVHVPNTCAFCESIQDVNWYCNDCCEALCDKCKEGHQRGKKTRNDDIIPIKKGNKRREAVLPEVCKTHRGKTCDLYCSDCGIAMCAMCFTETHKQHTFKNIEEEIVSQREYIQDQLQILKSNFDQLDGYQAKRHDVSKSFKESVDVVRQTVQTQRLILKTEIDSIADSVLDELSSLIDDEEQSFKQDCQSNEKDITEIKQLIRDAGQNTEKMSGASLFELTGRLKTAIPLYDASTKTLIPRPPHFVSGKPNADQLKSMIGYIKEDIRYERKEVDSKQVSQISTFRLRQQSQITSICPINDTHTWMSVHGCTELIKVNKKGKVTESVNLDFAPWCLTLTNAEELLITCGSPLIHKLTKDRQVTGFADISPLKAWGISVSGSDEVFVTTYTPEILVLNMSGERIRTILCEDDGMNIACLTTGNIVVTTGYNLFTSTEIIVIDKSDQITRRWNGEVDHGQKLGNTSQSDIARDGYDRVFVPDDITGQVYVISDKQGKAKCLLDEKHGAKGSCTVCVDRCGHVWIGCLNGTVHVMEL
ncbi:uncharacterized protein LOC110459423 [Mizuhopecten yessoensis]|uniref:uncharacterized protein LOC110459423 n=1 Tax=Mizuhopecten yessoensis TaxID=6573 RepID=UPI000B4575F4|nr:uncharacterized protein LOC110459423 [Mizuhopecten yessoensis]